jgi:hypothetical protein
MRFRLALVVFAFMVLASEDAAAQAPPLYWCDALHGYYPWVRFCPSGWRPVNPGMGSPQPYSAAPTPLTRQAAPAGAPIRSGEDIDDDLSDWCAQVTKPSSIVICADGDLRQMAMIRNKIFADAKPILSQDAYKQLLDDQTQWVQNYSSSCGIPADGPEPSQPISSGVIECFKREAKKRIADLVSRLGREKAGYSPTALSSVQASLVDQALRQRADEEKAEQQRQQAIAAEQAARESERAREQLRAQALADQQAALQQKLKDGGYKSESAIDLELDWRDFQARGQKVALQGTYLESDDVDGLMVSNNDMPVIRLYIDDASRDARKLMLQCRSGNYAVSSCKLIIAASVVTCIRNKDQNNQKEVPCLKVDEAFADPVADR